MDCTAPYGSTVVAKKSYIGHTQPIPATTIYTPVDDGDYRITLYAMIKNAPAGPNGTVLVGVGYTDEFNTYGLPDFGVPGLSFSQSGSSGTASAVVGQQAIIHVKGGTQIQINSLWYQGDAGHALPAGSYDLFITVLKE